MSADDEQEFLRQVRQHLDQHAETLDAPTAARLRAARERALDASPRPGLRWLPVTGLATAAAAVLAVLIWQHGITDLPLSAQDWDMLASGEELELFEDWEFYAWLEELQANS